MQQLFIENLRIGFKANLVIGQKLAAAVDAADMVAQPAAGVNHPAWILRHLSAYHPVLLDLLAGEVLAAVEALAGDDQAHATLTRPMPVPRWAEKFPQVGSIMSYLLIHHEGFHLGQLSAWRRVRGLPGV